MQDTCSNHKGIMKMIKWQIDQYKTLGHRPECILCKIGQEKGQWRKGNRKTLEVGSWWAQFGKMKFSSCVKRAKKSGTAS